MSTGKLVLTICSLLLLSIANCLAIDGSLDTSFNGTGFVTTDIGANDLGRAVAIQADGRIVVAGQADIGGIPKFGLVRYNSDGSLDTSFGGTGIVVTDIGTSSQAFAVAIQAAGKIVAAGRASFGGSFDFAVAKYNSDGSLDTSFNGTGFATTAIAGNDEAPAVALQADGKIVVAGIAASELALVRYINSPVLTPTQITFPANGSILNTSTPIIMGAAQNPSNITLFINGVEQLPGTVTIGAANQWAYTPLVPLADGIYTIIAVSGYKSGNVNFASDVVTFTVDTVAPPTPIIISPANGSTITTNIPTISGTASGDAISVDIVIDGIIVASNVLVINGAWSYTLSNLQALSEGAHNVQVVARDAAGNTSAPAISSFTVATIIPIPAPPVITQPANGSVVNTRTPTIAGTADSNFVAVQLFIASDPIVVTVPVINGTWSYTLTPEQALSDGFHSVIAVAINSAGSVSEPSNRVAFEVFTSRLSALSAAIRAKYCNFLS